MDKRSGIIVAVSAAVIAIAAIVGIATGGGKSGDNGSTAASASTASASTTQSAPEIGTGDVAVSKSTNLAAKPDMPAQKGKPPAKIVVNDIVVGKGAAAAKDGQVTVRYTGTLFAGGSEFDSSWKRTPNTTSFGLNQVVPCWQVGIVGMKVGGRRQLVCPSDTAYGQQGGPGIPPNSALVFVVDLVKTG